MRKTSQPFGQGTLEYLLIFGVVIVVTLVTIGLFSGMFSSSAGVSSTQNKIAVQTSGVFALTELSVNGDGNYFVRILSNNPDNITITNVQVGDTNQDFTTQLFQGNESNFIINTNDTCANGTITTKNITFTYTTRFGITKKQIIQNTQFQCENYSIPTTGTTTTEYSYTWYFNSDSNYSFDTDNNTYLSNGLLKLRTDTTTNNSNNQDENHTTNNWNNAYFVKQNDNNHWIPTGELDWNRLAVLDNNAWRDVNLVAYYKFNDTNGGTGIYDSARGYDGTLTNGATISGNGMWDTNALTLDGINDYVNIEAVDVVSGETQMSVTAWINLKNIGVNSEIVGQYNNTADDTFLFYINNGYLKVLLNNNGAVDYGIVSDFNILYDGWTYVAFTWDGGANVITGYVNGKEQATNVTTSNVSVLDSASTELLTIGGTWNYGQGQIDEIKIYNKKLTANEILVDYNSFLEAKFVDSNIVDAGASADWNQIKVNSDINYSFGKEICGNADTGCNADKFNNGLVGLWHLNSDATDSSGNGNDGTWTGTTTYASGLWNTNLASFNGSSYITAANESNFDFERTDTFSLSAWVYPTDFTNNSTIVSKSQDVWCQGPGYSIYLTTTGEVRVWVPSNHCAGDRIQADTNKMLELNKWAHVAITFDGSSTFSGTGVYIDGVKQENFNSVTDALTGSILTNQPLRIGRADAAGSPYAQFKGKIDEVAVWDVELTQNEVLDLYRKGVSRLDLNVYSCNDASCSDVNGSQYISDANNTSWMDLNSDIGVGRYLTFDALFRKASGFEDYNAGTFWTGAYLKDVNVLFNTNVTRASGYADMNLLVSTPTTFTGITDQNNLNGGSIDYNIMFDGNGDWITNPTGSTNFDTNILIRSILTNTTGTTPDINYTTINYTQ